MKAYLVVNFMGAFAFNEKGKLVAHRFFPAKPEEIAERMETKEQGASVKEELEIIKELGDSGYGSVSSKPDIEFDFRGFAVKSKWAKSKAEINKRISRANILLTRKKISVVKTDRVLMNIIGITDDLDRFLNMLSERLREWYGLYAEGPVSGESNEEFAHSVANSKQDSSGEINKFARSLAELYSVRKSMGKYLERLGNEAVPNLSAVAGPALAAKLLELAGGLEKLAKMSSTKIQMLGAEKALFRHMKGQGKAPKHGAIFSHPHIQSVQQQMRGKAARFVAAKLSLAARVDFFSHENRGQKMKKDLENQIKGLKGGSK